MSVWERMPGVDFPVFDDVTSWPPESPDEVTGLKVQARKVHEEAHEAASEMERAEIGDNCYRDALHELADVCQAVENSLYKLGASPEDWAEAVDDVRRANAVRGRFC